VTFPGILGPTHYAEYPRDAPTPTLDYASDLHLDQVLTTMLELRPQLTLAHLFWQLPRTVEGVQWCQEVLQDLQRSEVRSCVEEFSTSWAAMHRAWAQQSKSHNPHQQRAWHLHAVCLYLRAVTIFHTQLGSANPLSTGLDRLLEWLEDYCASQVFADLKRDAKEVLKLLEDVRYVLRIKGLSVRVSRPANEANFEALIEDTFSRFAHDISPAKLQTTRDTKDLPLGQELLSADTGRRVLSTDWELPRMQVNSGWISHVETRILDLVAQLFPEPFGSFEEFASRWPDSKIKC
jgi:DNA mismatch repair protein MutS